MRRNAARGNVTRRRPCPKADILPLARTPSWCGRSIDWWVRTNSLEDEVVSFPRHHNVRVVRLVLNECFIASSRLREDIGRRWLAFYERCRWNSNSVSNSGVS